MEHLGVVWGVPFLGLLISVGIGQAAFPKIWERWHGLLASFWIAVLLVPLALTLPGAEVAHAVAETILLDYLPFVVSILALYTLAGGIRIRTRMSGHPRENAILLGLGVLAGGVIGTPGATLLFLPVVLASNRWRRHRVHTLMFLIFLVANIGGGLTPLGPPLLVGYLRGVPFLWTVQAMLLPTAAVSGLLIALYAALDRLVYYPREDAAARAAHRQEHDTVTVEGGLNLLLLLVALVVQVACGTWTTTAALTVGSVVWPLPDLARIIALLALTALALRPATRPERAANHFHWLPMAEVAAVFAGIFVTLVPVLSILAAGRAGALGGILDLVSRPDGSPLDWAYFAVTGVLSGVLDNAPTFLVFFKAAGGDAASLTGAHASTLTAISAGAAFWGGLTYLGNAPNFMVRSVAEGRGIAMPHFAAYLGWSLAFLVPVFAVTAVLFFGAPLWGLAVILVPAVRLVFLRRALS